MEPFIGQIAPFPYDFTPDGWMECDGRMLPIHGYRRLFEVLGTKFGGDGDTGFAIPDLRGRVIVGAALPSAGGDAPEPTGGQAEVTLTGRDMPWHRHHMTVLTGIGSSAEPEGRYLVLAPEPPPRKSWRPAPEMPDKLYVRAEPDTVLSPVSMGEAGGGAPHSNYQPSLALRYCIAINGISPIMPDIERF